MQRWCYPPCQRVNYNTIHCVAEIMLLPNLSKSQYHPLWCRDDTITKYAKEPISSIVIQKWYYYEICQRANIIECIAERMLLPNLPKSQYHPLWFRDDTITKSAKEPISYSVLQRWCYYQIYSKSQYHSLWFRDDTITKSDKKPISYIVMQRWCCYQICHIANIIHCDAEMMILPNLAKSKYHPLWFRDDAITSSAKKGQYHPLWCRDDAITKSAKKPISYIVLIFDLIWFFTSTQHSFSYAGRVFLG